MRKIIMLFVMALSAMACTLTSGASAQLPQLPASTAEPIKPKQTAQVIEAKETTCTVTALEALNLRESPGTSSAVIATLKHGDLLTILPQPAQGVWIPVRAGDLEGWINSNYCERNNP
jgi:uncharacterized protein YgiM (DUF1202 family)